MTKLISHRGNITHKREKWENYPDYIEDAMNKGYDVEIDVWFTNWAIKNGQRVEYKENRWFLGHDTPNYEISFNWLIKYDILNILWCHAKTIPTLYELLRNNINCFFHNRDAVTLTSEGFLWTYPGYELTKYSIAVRPELTSYSESELKICYGICSDKIEEYNR